MTMETNLQELTVGVSYCLFEMTTQHVGNKRYFPDISIFDKMEYMLGAPSQTEFNQQIEKKNHN